MSGGRVMTNNGVEEDQDVRAALAWFAVASGNADTFVERLTRAQQAYRRVTALSETFGKDPSLETISQDVVGAFLAQAKSLLDDRRSFDIALASHIIPWMKQLGRNVHVLVNVPGANERVSRMLTAEAVAPGAAMFELVMASNYAVDGFDVPFVDEAGGRARTPDLRVSVSGLA